MKRSLIFTFSMFLCLLLCMPAVAYDSGIAVTATTISSAGDRTAVITSDGTLWMWGGFVTPFIDPQTGSMNMGYQSQPVKVLSDVVSVSCANYYTAAIKNDGSLWMWGSNSNGELGNGGIGDTVFNGKIYQLEPVKVMEDVAAVCCGGATAVIKTDGSLWVFGSNRYGQIGNNHVGNSTQKDVYGNEYLIQTIPVKIMEDVASVSCGAEFVAAVKKDGTLWTWGANQYGQLGNGERGRDDLVDGRIISDRKDRFVPVKILDNVVSVSCGGAHAAAIRTDGSLWMWGMNQCGCLGFGSTSASEEDGQNSTIPVMLMDDVVYVNCGNVITTAIKADGSLWMWGENKWYGLIDQNSNDNIGTPTKIMDGCRFAVSEGSNAITAFAVKNDGSLYGWGYAKYLGMSDSSDTLHEPIRILDALALPGIYTSVSVQDTPSVWAKDEIASAIGIGLVPKNLQQNYQTPVSRGEVAQMFINLIEQSSGKTIDEVMLEKGVDPNVNAFSDTNDKAVLSANALGIIQGIGNNKFDPDGSFTRAQIAAIINRIARIFGVDTDGYTHSFTDVTGHWVYAELGWPSGVGIINGVGSNKFDPDSELTTEQAIAIAYRALQVLLKQ